jgi:hypothetical protein
VDAVVIAQEDETDAVKEEVVGVTEVSVGIVGVIAEVVENQVAVLERNRIKLS